VSQVIVTSTEPRIATWHLAKDVWDTILVVRLFVVLQVLWPAKDILATCSITCIARAFPRVDLAVLPQAVFITKLLPASRIWTNKHGRLVGVGFRLLHSNSKPRLPAMIHRGTRHVVLRPGGSEGPVSHAHSVGDPVSHLSCRRIHRRLRRRPVDRSKRGWSDMVDGGTLTKRIRLVKRLNWDAGARVGDSRMCVQCSRVDVGVRAACRPIGICHEIMDQLPVDHRGP